MSSSPLLVPLITALAALCGTVVVRGTKVSEFRQAWIDQQREDIASALAAAAYLASTPRGDGVDEARKSLEEAILRIELRENPKKPEWQTVLGPLRALRRDLSPRQAHNITTEGRFASTIQGRIDSILDSSRDLLKEEWTRVRRGELGYTGGKVMTGLTILFFLALVWVSVAPPL